MILAIMALARQQEKLEEFLQEMTAITTGHNGADEWNAQWLMGMLEVIGPDNHVHYCPVCMDNKFCSEACCKFLPVRICDDCKIVEVKGLYGYP